MYVINKLRNGGNGTRVALFTLTSTILGSLYLGMKSKNEFHKWGLGGIVTTLTVETSTHVMSTIDLNSKTTKNFNVFQFVKQRGFTKLMDGFQPMIYGGILSSYFYYSCYKGIKESLKGIIKALNYNEKSLTSIAFLSSGASAWWELIAIWMYYPFDLIKIRMQNSEQHNYKNLTDAFYRMSVEKGSSFRFSNFYLGCGIYIWNYGMYTVLEFTFYETILAALVNHSKSKKSEQELEALGDSHKHRKNTHIVMSAFMAGCISGFIMNPIQYIQFNRQISHKPVRQILFELKRYRDLWTGVQFTSFYYGLNSTLVFLTLEKVWQLFDWTITEAD